MPLVLISFSCEETRSNSQGETKETVNERDAEPVGSSKTIPIDSLAVPSTHVRSLAYKGGDLGYLGTKYYGNKAYRNVLSAYNDFEDKRSVDKKHDTIEVPKLANLSKSEKLPKLRSIAVELDLVIGARDLYLKQESDLQSLPKDKEDRNFRPVPQAQKRELLGAAKRMYVCIERLEKIEDSPTKAIGQFKKVADNLSDIAKGKIDENGYALDMVHQRMAHGFANCIHWAKED